MRPHVGHVSAVVLTASLVTMAPESSPRSRQRLAARATPARIAPSPTPRLSAGHGGGVQPVVCETCGSGRQVPSQAPSITPPATPRSWTLRRPVRNTGRLPAPAPSSAHPVGNLFAVGTYFGQRGGTTSQIIRRTRLSGARWVREELTATEVHSGSTAPYNWQRYDRVVNAERTAGLHVLGLLDYSNTWGYGNHGTMPHAAMSELSADFAAYAYAAARHFRGRIRYWEIWNEPNLVTYWHPAPNPADYAALVDAASSSIKRADPTARIVLGGTSGVDLDFIRAVAAHTDRFDVLAVHPYRLEPETELLPEIRAMQSFKKPIWFSEIGWPAGSACPCSDEAEQAHNLVRFYALSAAAGVQRVFWYDFRDDAYGATEQERHFGLLRRDLSAKPAFAAYAFMAHTLPGTRFLDADRLDADGVYALRFRSGNGPIEILWNSGDSEQEVQIQWDRAAAVLVAEDGTVLDRLPVENGSVEMQLPAGGTPMYLLDRDPTYHLPLDATRPLPLPTVMSAPTRPVRRGAPRGQAHPTPLPHVVATRPPRRPSPTPAPPPSIPTLAKLTAVPAPPTITTTPSPTPTPVSEPSPVAQPPTSTGTTAAPTTTPSPTPTVTAPPSPPVPSSTPPTSLPDPSALPSTTPAG